MITMKLPIEPQCYNNSAEQAESLEDMNRQRLWSGLFKLIAVEGRKRGVGQSLDGYR